MDLLLRIQSSSSKVGDLSIFSHFFHSKLKQTENCNVNKSMPSPPPLFPRSRSLKLTSPSLIKKNKKIKIGSCISKNTPPPRCFLPQGAILLKQLLFVFSDGTFPWPRESLRQPFLCNGTSYLQQAPATGPTPPCSTASASSPIRDLSALVLSFPQLGSLLPYPWFYTQSSIVSLVLMTLAFSPLTWCSNFFLTAWCCYPCARICAPNAHTPWSLVPTVSNSVPYGPFAVGENEHSPVKLRLPASCTALLRQIHRNEESHSHVILRLQPQLLQHPRL